jgi:hypothetical protein
VDSLLNDAGGACPHEDLVGLADIIEHARTEGLPSPFTVYVRAWVPALNAQPLQVVAETWTSTSFLDCDKDATMRFLTADLLLRRLRDSDEWAAAFTLTSDLEAELRFESMRVLQRMREAMEVFGSSFVDGGMF